jgi:hypothetical protein
MEFERALERATLKSGLLMLIHSMVAEGFDSFPQRILVDAELEFSKGRSSKKIANRRPRMRHVHDQTGKHLKEVSRVQHCQL